MRGNKSDTPNTQLPKMNAAQEYAYLQKRLHEACNNPDSNLTAAEHEFWDRHNQLQHEFRQTLDAGINREARKQRILAAIVDEEGQFDPVGVMALAGIAAHRDACFSHYFELFKRHVHALKKGIVRVARKRDRVKS